MIAPASVTLRQWVRKYIIFRTLKPRSEYQLQRSAEIFIRWRGYDPLLVDCCDEVLSDFIKNGMNQYAERTRKRIRGDLLSLVNAAAEAGYCDRPRMVRVVKCAPPDPQIWTPEQVQRLLQEAAKLPPHSRGVRNLRVRMVGLILATWDTGLRMSDVQRLKHDETQIVEQQKTGRLHPIRLRQNTQEAIKDAGKLAWPAWPRSLYRWFGIIRERAGLGKTGAFQQLRRSSATDVLLSGGNATRFLGHTSTRADAFYLPRWAIAGEAQCPRELQ